ncbi:DUF2637 domain-containing protein [Frankia sp. Cr2]|uniref:DUF2637 domain-containing protein n=1 Tax=Frankia sp. Cr2 TaxID=3073932 RepID=UPI002AD1EA34|nr:DUF2637 domain-containing protein [Frankia sp. Cr2]
MDRAISAATVMAVVTVAAVAAFVSYRHMRGVALDHGEDVTAAAVIPFSVDGLMLAASMTMLADRRAGRSRSWLSYLLLTMGAFASLAANVLHAEPNLTARVIAGWPALALLGSYELLMRQIRVVGSRLAASRAASAGHMLADITADRGAAIAADAARDMLGVPRPREAHRDAHRTVYGDTHRTVHGDAQRPIGDLVPIFASQAAVTPLVGGDPDSGDAGGFDEVPPSPTLDIADKREAIVHALEQTNGSASQALAFLAARGITVSKSWVYEVRKESHYADVYTGPLPIIDARATVGSLG